jgi:tRNA modification GTPase
MINKTIAAISTPFGRGGVALIRVSGDEALDICEKVFFPFNKKKLSECEVRSAVYGEIVSENTTVDDGIAIFYKAPASYTGEDTVEISCHGGIHLASTVLQALFTSGAVPAEAGEFTKRAFLNGKLSLTEAESVINLIDAVTDEQIKLASSHRRGVLSKYADKIYGEILALVSSTYAYIDYPDEDLTDVSVDELKNSLTDIKNELLSLEKSYKRGKAVSEGIKTVIVGKPNAGKSSLLNTLLGEKRAIVTDIAGTTRDVIEENVKLDHIVLRLSDTAGIRETEDKVEKIGVDLALEKIADSELVFAVFDVSGELSKEDTDLITYLKEKSGDKKVIAVLNKTDLGQCVATYSKLKDAFENTVLVSTVSSDGTDKLCEIAEKMFFDGEIDYNTDAVIANARQNSAVISAREAVSRAISSIEKGFTQDIAGMDLEAALGAIAELDSRNIGEDIVNDIFSRFCIGK